jgi:hypothetical protein
VSTELERGIVEPRQFSIAHGPSLRLLHRLHLTRADGTPRAWVLVAIAWVPLFAGALLRVAVGERPAPILFDISVHTRLLIGIPLLVQAERMLEQRCRGAVNQLYRGNFAERAATDRIIDRAERLRDSRLVEVMLFVLLIAGAEAMLWGFVGPTGLFTGVSEAGELSFARLWYVTVSWPIAQFLFLRWLWHWTIWSYVLVRLSRVPLATIATHPDHAAGLGFLGGPMAGFAGFVLAISTLLASAWGTQILAGRAEMQAFVPSFFGFAVLAVVVACGPLLPFVGILYRARHREVSQYNGLALDYMRTFHRKWVESRPTENLLGTPDLQSMNDLCGAYTSLVQVRLVPFGPRQLSMIWIAALIPMIPLIATAVPIDKLIRTIGGALLGGIPM